jgi:hypothetical protein
MVYANNTKAANIICFSAPNLLYLYVFLYEFKKILVRIGSFAPPVFKAAIMVLKLTRKLQIIHYLPDSSSPV